MIKKITSMLLFVVILTGCSKKNEYTEIVYADKYSVEVPTVMQKTKALNSAATLQLQDKQDELYLIVIDENKEAIKAMFESAGAYEEGDDVFTLFAEATLEYLKATLDSVDSNELKLQNVVVHNLQGKTTEFVASIAGLDVYYKFAAIEGKNDYYQVLTWTLKEKRDQHQQQMEVMINSFKEVK